MLNAAALKLFKRSFSALAKLEFGSEFASVLRFKEESIRS